MSDQDPQTTSRRSHFFSATIVAAIALTMSGLTWMLLQSQQEFTDFETLPALADRVRLAEKVHLYEGLPHQFWEPKTLQAELKSKHSVNLGGYPFYEEPLPLSATDAQLLKEWFCNPQSFSEMPEGWAKACGEFHPDYCVQWKAGSDTYNVLVCFDCHEVKFLSPDANIHCDIQQPAYERVQAILTPYRKNRPIPYQP